MFVLAHIEMPLDIVLVQQVDLTHDDASLRLDRRFCLDGMGKTIARVWAALMLGKISEAAAAAATCDYDLDVHRDIDSIAQFIDSMRVAFDIDVVITMAMQTRNADVLYRVLKLFMSFKVHLMLGCREPADCTMQAAVTLRLIALLA